MVLVGFVISPTRVFTPGERHEYLVEMSTTSAIGLEEVRFRLALVSTLEKPGAKETGPQLDCFYLEAEGKLDGKPTARPVAGRIRLPWTERGLSDRLNLTDPTGRYALVLAALYWPESFVSTGRTRIARLDLAGNGWLAGDFSLSRFSASGPTWKFSGDLNSGSESVGKLELNVTLDPTTFWPISAVINLARPDGTVNLKLRRKE